MRKLVSLVPLLLFVNAERLVGCCSCTGEAAFQVRSQQTMEQMLSCLASDRQSPRHIGARLQSTLHSFANVQVFRLNTIAYYNALLVVFLSGFTDITEKEIKNDTATIHTERHHQIRIHVSCVTINHQVGILPEVPGAVAFARAAGGSIFRSGHHRTRLQTITVLVLDGVLLIIEHRIQALMQMWDVISAIQIIVYENLPIALD